MRRTDDACIVSCMQGSRPGRQPQAGRGWIDAEEDAVLSIECRTSSVLRFRPVRKWKNTEQDANGGTASIDFPLFFLLALRCTSFFFEGCVDG